MPLGRIRKRTGRYFIVSQLQWAMFSCTFWWLGDSKGWCLTLRSLSVISFIFILTCRRNLVLVTGTKRETMTHIIALKLLETMSLFQQVFCKTLSWLTFWLALSQMLNSVLEPKVAVYVSISAYWLVVSACPNLVNPKDHSILQVKGQLFGGPKSGEAFDRSHHFLNADHFYCVGHH